MLKHEELSNPESCINRAQPGEMVFVLLARDEAAPLAIRAWCEYWVRIGKNTWGDPQIIEAQKIADHMDATREQVKKT